MTLQGALLYGALERGNMRVFLLLLVTLGGCTEPNTEQQALTKLQVQSIAEHGLLCEAQSLLCHYPEDRHRVYASEGAAYEIIGNEASPGSGFVLLEEYCQTADGLRYSSIFYDLQGNLGAIEWRTRDLRVMCFCEIGARYTVQCLQLEPEAHTTCYSPDTGEQEPCP